MSLGFGLIAHVIAGRGTTLWMWLIAAPVFFVSGLLISEVWSGSSTKGDLQPNIDGLSLDEVRSALVPAMLAMVLTRYLTRRGRRHL